MCRLHSHGQCSIDKCRTGFEYQDQQSTGTGFSPIYSDDNNKEKIKGRLKDNDNNIIPKLIDSLNGVLCHFQQYFSHVTVTAHIIHVFPWFQQY